MNLLSPARHIEIIVNPAAGQPEPVLRVFHDVFTEAGVSWNIDVTTDLKEIPEIIDRAVSQGSELVAAYGGDGTISAVAASMQGKPIPMAILPGGTGNVMASELGIPLDLETACRQLLTARPLRKVDLGMVNGRPFILRVGIGLEAEMVTKANSQDKSRLGTLAYGLAALAALREPQESEYHLEVDGEEIQQTAVTCLVINSGNLGRPELQLAQGIKIDDGILDVALLRQVDLDSMTEILASVVGSQRTGRSFLHWQGKRIRVEANPHQPAEADGEAIGYTPFDFEIKPGKVMIIEGGR